MRTKAQGWSDLIFESWPRPQGRPPKRAFYGLGLSARHLFRSDGGLSFETGFSSHSHFIWAFKRHLRNHTLNATPMIGHALRLIRSWRSGPLKSELVKLVPSSGISLPQAVHGLSMAFPFRPRQRPCPGLGVRFHGIRTVLKE